MSFKSFRRLIEVAECSTLAEFSKVSKMPYRTLQNWELNKKMWRRLELIAKGVIYERKHEDG